MTRHGLLALGPAVLAATALGSAPWAATGPARLDLNARFDRAAVQAGQVAVADIAIRNPGPVASGRATITLSAVGGAIVRTHARGARCARPDGAGRVRCGVGVRTFGSIAEITVHVSVGARAGTLRLVAASAAAAGPAVARTRVERRDRTLAELSFVLEAPAVATVGRTFTARTRILNRGPGGALVGPVTLSTRPAARVTLSRPPQRLAVGAERAVTARVTPLRAGRLVLELRIGQGGKARLGIGVRTPSR